MLDTLTLLAQEGGPAGGLASNATLGGVMGGTLFGALLLWLTRVKLPGDDAANVALRDRLFKQLEMSEAARKEAQVAMSAERRLDQDRFLAALDAAERKCSDERRELRAEINAKDEANRLALMQLKDLITHDVSVTKESAKAASDLAQASEKLAGAVTSATRRKDGDSGIHQRPGASS